MHSIYYHPYCTLKIIIFKLCTHWATGIKLCRLKNVFVSMHKDRPFSLFSPDFSQHFFYICYYAWHLSVNLCHCKVTDMLMLDFHLHFNMKEPSHSFDALYAFNIHVQMTKPSFNKCNLVWYVEKNITKEKKQRFLRSLLTKLRVWKKIQIHCSSALGGFPLRFGNSSSWWVHGKVGWPHSPKIDATRLTRNGILVCC